MAHFGELLAELRQDHGLTQDQLAEIISVSPGTISNYEHGRHLPDLDKLKMIADYFHVTTDYLLGRTSSSIPNESNHHLLFSIFYMKLTATLSNQWSKAINQCL